MTPGCTGPVKHARMIIDCLRLCWLPLVRPFDAALENGADVNFSTNNNYH